MDHVNDEERDDEVAEIFIRLSQEVIALSESVRKCRTEIQNGFTSVATEITRLREHVNTLEKKLDVLLSRNSIDQTIMTQVSAKDSGHLGTRSVDQTGARVRPGQQLQAPRPPRSLSQAPKPQTKPPPAQLSAGNYKRPAVPPSGSNASSHRGKRASSGVSAWTKISLWLKSVK